MRSSLVQPHAAGWKPAIRQIENLRYLLGRVAGFGLALVFGGLTAEAAERSISIGTNEDGGLLEVRFKGQKLLVYAFATNQFKPYVRELYSLRGENVLRDAPPDHLHHHGMMYAVYVNGVNFWEERGTPGIQRHAEMSPAVPDTIADGMHRASFREFIQWLCPSNQPTAESAAVALLNERRTLTVTVDEKSQEVALRWESQFVVGSNAAKVKIHGPNYNGLGLRLPESFNHVARFQNSADQPYTGKNTQNVIPAGWTSVSGVMEGRDVMLVMFGRKDNARGDGLYFTMLDPFAYLAVTQGLDKQPLEYAAGDKFSLSYLLTVYTENKSADFIRLRSVRWNKERR